MNQRILAQWLTKSVKQWMKQRSNKSVIPWMNEPMNQWINIMCESVNHWSNVSMNQWSDEATHQWISESMKQRINESMNRWTNESFNLSRFCSNLFLLWTASQLPLLQLLQPSLLAIAQNWDSVQKLPFRSCYNAFIKLQLQSRMAGAS